MKKPMYSIFDQIAGFYCPIFLAENDPHAIRMAQQSLPMQHAQDFVLQRLGTFDTSNGIIDAEQPVTVASGLSLKGETE